MRSIGCLVALFLCQFCTLHADDNSTFHYLSHMHGNKTEGDDGKLPTKGIRDSSCEEKNTCLGHDCNYWIKRGRNSQNGNYNTCESLESDHGCNCAGCWCDCESDCSGTFCGSNMDWLGDGSCDDGSTGIDFNCEEFQYDHGDCKEKDEKNEKLKTENECANTCYGASCDFWLFVGDYDTCDHLESYWGCNCNGCTCCRTDCQGKLCAHHSNKLNDGHCDDGCDGQCLDFNCDKFHFDQGDCPNATTTKAVVPVVENPEPDRTKLKNSRLYQTDSTSAFLVVGIVCIVLVLCLILATCVLCFIARRVMRPVTAPVADFPSVFSQYLGGNQSGEQTPVAEEVDFSGCSLELSYVAPSNQLQSDTREESVSDAGADAAPVGGGDGDGEDGGSGDVEIEGDESSGSGDGQGDRDDV